MFTRIIVLIALLAVAFAGKKLEASVKENVSGVDGLNIKWRAPFKFQDAVVGFSTTLGDLKRVPEEFFAKKVFHVGGGDATVDAEYHVDDKQLSVNTKWVSAEHGLELGVAGNSKDHVTKVSAAKTEKVRDHNLRVKAVYDLIKEKLTGSAHVSIDDTEVEIDYDNGSHEAVLHIAHKVDDKNTVSPTVNLKSGDISYGWTRKINGGSVESRLHPGDRLELDWKDNGAHGAWHTKAEVPLDDHSKSKVSFSRDWNY